MLKSDTTVESILVSPSLLLTTVETNLDWSFLILIEDYKLHTLFS